MKREYFDADFKNQAKRKIEIFIRSLQLFGGVIHDSHESKYFTGKQAWRNPIVFRVSLPVGKRWEFISASKIWLARPQVVTIAPVMPEPYYARPIVFHSVDHQGLPLRRRYQIQGGYIFDLHPVRGDRTFNSPGIVQAVLNGDLDLLGEKP